MPFDSEAYDKMIFDGIKKLETNFATILKLFNDQQDEVVRLEKWIQRQEKRLKRIEIKNEVLTASCYQQFTELRIKVEALEIKIDGIDGFQNNIVKDIKKIEAKHGILYDAVLDKLEALEKK